MKEKTAKLSGAEESLLSGLRDALDYERGHRKDLTVRDVSLKPPKQLAPKAVAAIRQSMHVSQGVFAQLLNVSASAVQAWERGARTPSDAALKLLHIAKRHPEVFAD